MTEEDRQLRAAAETLLSNSLESQRGSYTHRSISSINRDFVISEDLIAGSRYNGRMSSARRFFCLLVTFDLLFTGLMWLICTTIAGESISVAFVQQVLHYRIRTSLFDIVMAAIFRFILLLLFYAMLQLNHWAIVALTTASTCAFLGAKAYFFTWTEVPQPGFQGLLILMSFVLAWSEAWYFDCRVVPQEMQAQNWLLNVGNSERSPLLQHIFDGPPSRMGESMGNFFTPMDSPTHSDTEDDRVKVPKTTFTTDDEFQNALQREIIVPPGKIDDYKVKAAALVDKSYELLMSDEWTKINVTPAGDVISIKSTNIGKILKIEGIVNAPAHQLIDCLHDNIEDLPTWNDDIALVKKIQTIDASTDITYQATKTYGGGLVGPRDFVTLRHRNMCGQYHISSGISVHVNLPPRKNHVRAENGIVCLAAEHLESDNGNAKCRVTWIMHANLKGWLPQKVIDTSVAGMLEKMIGLLRTHVSRLSDSFG